MHALPVFTETGKGFIDYDVTHPPGTDFGFAWFSVKDILNAFVMSLNPVNFCYFKR